MHEALSYLDASATRQEHPLIFFENIFVAVADERVDGVCVCVCSVCVCVCVCARVHIYIYMMICVCMSAYTSMYIYSDHPHKVCVFVRVCVRARVHFVCVYVCTHRCLSFRLQLPYTSLVCPCEWGPCAATSSHQVMSVIAC